MNLAPARLVELVVALLIIGAGVWVYRRKPAGGGDGNYGSQGAVILFVIGLIVAIHAIGGMDYRPSQSELETMKARAR